MHNKPSKLNRKNKQQTNKNNPNRKWAKYVSKHFTGDVQMANEHME